MNYWLFSVIYDNLPKTWPKMVQMGIAAQHYPPGWTNEGKNLKYLQQLRRGDKLIAAFHGHRFGGYGTLTSDFYRGGPSMAIKGRNGIYEFQERADCEWTTLPLRGSAPYLDLHELKKKGFSIDLTIGLCVKQIDKSTFDAVRHELDKAGAKPLLAKEGPRAIEKSKDKRLADVAFERIEALSRSYESGSPVMPPSIIFNEGWMLRLILDRFAGSATGPDEHILAVPQDCRWYSEALMPTAFVPVSRGDLRGEAWSHADGVIGHFDLGIEGGRKLKLRPDAKHFVVVEAKMSSPLSPSVKNAPGYNQAARNIACIVETIRRAGIEPGQFATLGFCVLAPEKQLERGLTKGYLEKASLSTIVENRVIGYGDSPGLLNWFEDWFRPVLDRLTIKQISWEDTLRYLVDKDQGARFLEDFYERCLKININVL